MHLFVSQDTLQPELGDYGNRGQNLLRQGEFSVYERRKVFRIPRFRLSSRRAEPTLQIRDKHGDKIYAVESEGLAALG